MWILGAAIYGYGVVVCLLTWFGRSAEDTLWKTFKLALCWPLIFPAYVFFRWLGGKEHKAPLHDAKSLAEQDMEAEEYEELLKRIQVEEVDTWLEANS